MTDIIKAIIAINPDAQVSVNANDVDQITWLHGTSIISKSDILAKQTELQTAYDALEWKRNRQKEYPNHEDCIHALLDGGDTLTDLQTKRTTVKDKYPKN
tara:strand:- start:41 stop:340 length:300 start_codon:yes stop_codon:yes gene_type:complete